MINAKKRLSFYGARSIARLLFFGIACAAALITNRASAAGMIDYVLTTQYDPATPDQTIEFDVTVHNLTTSSQPVALGWTVPQYTTFGSSGCSAAGCPKTTDFGTLAAGQSMTQQLRLRVADTSLVPEGSPITLTLNDQARAASISRSVVVRDSPALALALSTDQGTVAPGGNFTYTLAAANISGGSSPGATLTAVVPQGATFVSADGTGVLDGGVVSWALGSLGAGANIQRHVTFQVSAAGGNPLGPIEASFTDSSGHVARASDNRVVIQAPAIQYTLTKQYDPATPDQTIEFDVTVHNLTTSSQPVALGWTVPQYTTFGSSGCSAAGCPKTTDFGTLTAGQSMTQQLRLRVADIAAVADGANIILELFDLSRAASISRSVVVRATPPSPCSGTFNRTRETVAPRRELHVYAGGSENISGGSSPGATLTAVVPQGATFVSADGTRRF